MPAATNTALPGRRNMTSWPMTIQSVPSRAICSVFTYSEARLSSSLTFCHSEPSKRISPHVVVAHMTPA